MSAEFPAPDTDAFLAELARRASGLQNPPLPRAERLDEPAVRARWKRWLRFGGGHDWRVLRRRMRAEGLYPASLFQPRRIEALPGWCTTVRDIMTATRRGAATPLPPGCQAAFRDLFAPTLGVARERLAARGPAPDATVFAPSALHGLENALLERLAEIAGPCLIRLFDAERKPDPLRSLLGAPSDEPAGRAGYDAFVARLRADGLAPLFARWPVLARLLATIVEHWTDNAHELRTRAARDHAAVRATFFPTAPLAAFTSVHATLSDHHAGGRTVLMLGFADGGRIVYKPRPVDTEAVFSASVAWLDERLAAHGQPRHRVARVLAGDGYGWMEWIEDLPMAAGEEPAYHWRLGSLLALYRALNGTDLHHENLVAAGASPVLVDVECVLRPKAAALADTPVIDAPPSPADVGALVQTAALPFYSFDRSGTMAHSHGAIARHPGDSAPARPTFVHADTDHIRIRQQPAPPVTHHHPRTAAGWVDSLAYRHDIAAGYRATLEHVLAERDFLLADEASPWHALRRAEGRLLVRATWNYGLLLDAATSPEALTDGVVFDLTFEALHRNLAVFSAGFRAMALAERTALRDLDVPRMGYVASDTAARGAHGEVLLAMSAEPPWDTMEQGLRRLAASGIEHEAQAIVHLLATPPRGPITGETAAGRLRSAADMLRANAWVGEDGTPTWYSLQHADAGMVAGPVGAGLYDGATGIAFALAAAARVLDDGSLARLAGATLAATAGNLRQFDRASARSGAPDMLPAGFDQGRAGMLFALHHGARLGGDDALADEVRELAATWIASAGFQRALHEDRSNDVLNGASGVALVLLALADRGGDRQALVDAARACGDRLLANARGEPGALWWGHGQGRGLSGLSHGGAGFAVALASLYRATGHRPLRDAAFGALGHEARLFDAERGNWRDMRGAGGADPSTVQACGCSWCHGAPGIVLARAALLRILDADLTAAERDRIEEDLTVGLGTLRQTFATAHEARIDDLCCGTAGRIDIALECGRLLGRADLVSLAHETAARCLTYWQENALARPRLWFTEFDLATGDASLFKGSAGWVYLQARLMAPDTVPCVLLPLPGA